jgi:predicted transcriptional regulator
VTDAQFNAIAHLLRLRAGPAREGARLVLVEGRRQVDVAAMLGISPAALSNAVARVRRGAAVARTAAIP